MATTNKIERQDRIVWITYDRVIWQYEDGRTEDSGKYHCYWSNTEPKGLFYGQRFVNQNNVPILFDRPEQAEDYYFILFT